MHRNFETRESICSAFDLIPRIEKPAVPVTSLYRSGLSSLHDNIIKYTVQDCVFPLAVTDRDSDFHFDKL